ncbi:MAG: glucosidase [Verrucomicrobiota bacterium]
MAAKLFPELQRVRESEGGGGPWRKWGPYLAERQWGTVREDYSAEGKAWEYITHDMSRSYAYRWGEDGLGGFSDNKGRLNFSVALWNGNDPILKERLYGLGNHAGSHGEDVKELYYFLDATPSHSWNRMLYKYPQRSFPYNDLAHGNAQRDKALGEYEIWQTDAFDEDRYFDVTIDYAKEGPEDVLCRISAINRGPESAPIVILPQLTCRNSWVAGRREVPTLQWTEREDIEVDDPDLGLFFWSAREVDGALFTNNETNRKRLYGEENVCQNVKDAFHQYVVEGKRTSVCASKEGTKAAYLRRWNLRPGQEAVLEWRLTRRKPRKPFARFDAIMESREREADQFYRPLQKGVEDPEERKVQRQAWAGLLWSKQYYRYTVENWLDGDPVQPKPPADRGEIRNGEWRHLRANDVLSMPDTWEYPWFAVWDLAFHCVPFAMIDPEFAKCQLSTVLREWYLHPNGQIPAYEWNFEDVNPPVHAWACLRVFQIDRKNRRDQGDLAFLESVFHKLMINFTWWVNRKDKDGNNLFQGGFLGLDNIGVFDRSKPLPGGGYLHQADGTAWMGFYSLTLMKIALELAQHNPVYEDIATKFFEHFLYIAQSLSQLIDGGHGLWDDEDGFYYDVLVNGDGEKIPMKVRSIVGLITLYSVEVLEPEDLASVPDFVERMEWVLENKPELAKHIASFRDPGQKERLLLSLFDAERLRRVMKRLLDEKEFLSPYGIRALSKYHEEHPFRFQQGKKTVEVKYNPKESDSYMFGGNSNWRGPVWFPVNYLLYESLQKFHFYFGDGFKVEAPTGSGHEVTLEEAAEEIARRLVGIFLPDQEGNRPVYGHAPLLRDREGFRENPLFYEYFHGDSGRGVGAEHQTGWTALVAKLIGSLHRGHD